VTSSHYFSSKPTSKEEFGRIETVLRGKRISLVSATGVFSVKRVDNGTRILAENMTIPEEGDFLDLGCGIGVIGIVAAIENPSLSVHLTDVNPRAVQLARLNVERLKLKNCHIYEGNLYEPLGDKRFNLIVSNPPISAGMHKVVHPMVTGAYERLVEGGLLQMVIQSNKGSKMLASFFDEVFGYHEILAIKSGYRVFTSIRY
jgi:16S rRNA (guanine1207-N2)-methyltransferase